jgi:hypothetical protein
MIKDISIGMVLLILVAVPLQGLCETPEEYKLKDSDLSIDNANDNLNEIEQALKDYKKFSSLTLTYDVLDKLRQDNGEATIVIRKKDLDGFTTTDWTIQNIGFTNWIIMVRGTLLRSDYLLKKCEYELSKNQKNASESRLSELKKMAEDARVKYQSFLSRVVLLD